MGTLTGRDLLSLADLSREEIAFLLEFAAQLKAKTVRPHCPKVLGLVFSKASTRTRVSFSTAMFQMGGQVLDLNSSITQVGRGEPIEDTARVLDRYLDAVAIRTFEQAEVECFARYAAIPVINALTDLEHPCQILADLLTVQENFQQLSGLTLTYLGDGNNIAHSLLIGCALVDMNIRIAAPPNYQPLPEIVAKAQAIAGDRCSIEILSDPQAAVQGSHILYTDVWASMGQEASADDRIPIFMPYQINADLLSLAAPEAIVLHCLPAYRGKEITHEAMEGKASRIWDQAENRLHTQKALLAAVLDAQF
ncbi:MAG TPA: ornithine carbamoyltransferase [Stenomitos sp.]